MDFRWQDVDSDLRWFATWGVATIAIGFFLKWCDLFQDVGPELDWQPSAEKVEEWRAE